MTNPTSSLKLVPILGVLAWSTPAAALDLDLYAQLLGQYTHAVQDTAGTRVDYAGLRQDPAWRRLVGTLEASDPGALSGRNQRLAFWINAYNILAIDWLVREGPVASIRDLGSLVHPVWKKPAGRIGGHEVTLDQIEDETLRPLGEPRIHFAIVCASTSCPSLRREPFRAGELERQLDDQARSFLSNPHKGLVVDRQQERVRISKIFDWFDEDFGKDEGTLAFLTRYASPPDWLWLVKHAHHLKVDSLPYDWNANAVAGRR